MKEKRDCYIYDWEKREFAGADVGEDAMTRSEAIKTYKDITEFANERELYVSLSIFKNVTNTCERIVKKEELIDLMQGLTLTDKKELLRALEKEVGGRE